MNSDNRFRYGYRIVDDTTNDRRLINWGAAFVAHAQCDDRAEVNRECYLSAFEFGDDFRDYLTTRRTTKDFNGPCWASWLWWDIDRAGDFERATLDARRLVVAITERFSIDGDDVLVFASGGKGFHIGIPTALWQPAPSNEFHRTAKQFAERIAATASVSVDGGIYDKVRAFRAPNSRHPKTGRHKRRFEVDELMHVSADGLLRRAERPLAFELPATPATSQQAVDDWQAATEAVQRNAESAKLRRVQDGATLNRQTLNFLRDGATVGDRHRLLFSSAANLAEFGCPPALAHALLTEPALDSGLTPSEVRRQIDCGLDHHQPKD